jgi:UDP-N-acetylglucosamine--N-acetylmuramyl-(pentapeptide) pyrophosphoryl-undecaprenol N-acetylglucosamine transferase
MKLALCGGGTGGHVYPALCIATALQRELPSGEKLEPLYLGSQEGAEASLMERADIPLHPISSGPVRGRKPWEFAGNAARMAVGVAQARGALSEFGAEVLLTTGGYTSFPVAVAARARNIPIVLYLPDVYPGWAVRAIARIARRIAVTAPETLRRLPGSKTAVAGYPVREEFLRITRPEGRRRLSLDPGDKVLLVAGASQGAHSINHAVADNLSGLLELCTVVHVSGRADEMWLAQIAKDLPAELRSRYHLSGYLHEEFPWALAGADLALCRAGASVLGAGPAPPYWESCPLWAYRPFSSPTPTRGLTSD